MAAAALTGFEIEPADADEELTTVVRVLGGGVLQVATPDGGAGLHIGDFEFDGTINVADLGNPLEAVSPCVLTEDGRDVLCPRFFVDSLLVVTGEGDDQVTVDVDLPIVVSTGPGDDSVRASTSPSASIILGPGDDSIRPDSGAIDVVGGDGEDEVFYRDNSALAPGIVVRLDDVTNDGPAPLDDNIHSDIEDITTGDGDDLLVGSDSANVFDGGWGDDQMFGLAGDDKFVNQIANVNTGADEMFGGIGTDTVSYGGRADGGVIVRLDDVALDGRPGEGDNVHSDIENIIGSERSDVLTGNQLVNIIIGGNGRDLIDGGLGADILYGGDRVDTVTYMNRTRALAVSLDDVANDGLASEFDNVASDVERITGGSGRDVLIGNANRNVFAGEGGRDILRGLAGNDHLVGGDGPDVGNGGPGMDLCETETRIAC